MMNTYIEILHDELKTVKKVPILSQNSAEQFSKTKKLEDFKSLTKLIESGSDKQALDFINKHVDLCCTVDNVLLSTYNETFFQHVNFDKLNTIINLKRINLIKDINSHLFSVNKLLPLNGFYIGRVETYWERKIGLIKKYGKHPGEAIWLLDFILNRVIPKTRYIDKIYFLFRKKRQAISKAEMLGRLCHSGFTIVDYVIIDKLFYFLAKKTGEPSNNQSPTFRPLVKLQRIGKNGKIINVYKLRTMHPYSEYLQAHVLKVNGYNEVGKPAYDFRVARWGKLLRKIWLDELPQLINVLKGEMKLVGVRPLSQVRFNQLPTELQKERIKHKPGCFPPYVALNMPDAIGNIEAERIYFRDKAKNPYTTDIKYLIRSVSNILRNKIRSS